MPQQTSVMIYRDVVLECQHCYMICRYSDAEVRQSCPSCGRDIANWAAIMESVRQEMPQSSRRTEAAHDTPPTSPKSTA